MRQSLGAKIPSQFYQNEAVRRLAQRKLQQLQTSATFQAFVRKVNPRYQWYRHCEIIASVAERVASGELSRVMIFVPPRHSKSETVSRLFSAYYLRRFPDRWVGLMSYSSELAYVLSRASQDNYIASGGALNAKAGAVKHWETGRGGGLWAAGVGGPITGKGFHLGIIDDPLKNSEEASSPVIRAKQKEWYQSTFYTRGEPGAAVVIIQTRWHEDDLSGWLLAEEEGDSPERWHIVNLPAIAEQPRAFPASCTVEPDGRAIGAALCDARYDIERLRRIESRIGGYYFDALYQQRPSAKEGALFKVARLEIVDAAPAGLRPVRAWDLAASLRGDYTAGVKMARGADGLFYVLDVVRGQWSPDDRNATMRQTAALDGRECKIRIAQDPGQAGVDQVQTLTRMLAGYTVRSERVSGAKEVRADGFAAQVNAGNVRLVKGAWNAAFIEELRSFPLGKHDDATDASSDAFAELTLSGEFTQRQWLR